MGSLQIKNCERKTEVQNGVYFNLKCGLNPKIYQNNFLRLVERKKLIF